MKVTKTKRRVLLIVVVLAAVAATVILFAENYDFWFNKDNRIKITKPANGSAGIHWEYTINNDNVLREAEYYTKRFFLNFGPGYDEVWVFDQIGEGEVTFNWTEYTAGTDKVSSHTETYRVGSDGEFELIADSRHPWGV